MKPYRIPFHIKLNRFLMRPIFRALFQTLGRVKTYGMEHVPLGKPYVLAINHISIFDPPAVLSFWPETAEVIGAAEVFGWGSQGTVLRMYGTIPVYHGQYDRALLETMTAVIQAGLPLMIAPEGGRSHQLGMQRAWPGIGYLIERTNVPVVPVGLTGTTSDFWQRAKRGEKPQVELRIGKPVQFPPLTAKGTERRTLRQNIADTIMRHIAGLLPEEYHGVYAGQAIRASS